jgi:uncharacterized membrane protein YfcA
MSSRAPLKKTPLQKPALWFVPVGFAIGFAGALGGVGGGIFAGPFLHSVCGLSLRRAAATALLVVLATTLTSSVIELYRPDSKLALEVAVPLAIGALLGAGLGFRIAQRIDERTLKIAFVLLLGLGGVRVLFFTQALGGGAPVSTGASIAIALAIGVAGGFLTPLGVAGGVFMTPALFLSLGSLGFVGARACALAAGAVGAVRSLGLHARARNVDYALGWPLAVGSLLGAIGGVAAAYDPDLAHWGRILLGVVLLLQAARFLLELRRPAAVA